MIRTRYLAFSVETYKELCECYPDLCETYILENKDAFMTIVATVPLEKDTFENVVISKQTDQKIKEALIKHHGEKLMSETVADQICSMTLSIPKNVFNAAWDILDVSKRTKLMLTHIYSESKRL